jgi:hypothetical protein
MMDSEGREPVCGELLILDTNQNSPHTGSPTRGGTDGCPRNAGLRTVRGSLGDCFS